MTTLLRPNCHKRGCRHYRGVIDIGTPSSPNPIHVCAAFPDPPGIPNAIAYGRNKHIRPYPGDHGIQYEPKEDEKA